MPGFEPGNPACAECAQSRFDRQQVMTLRCAKLTRPAPGECEIPLPYMAGSTREHGYFHGCIIGTITDSAGGHAGLTLPQTLMTLHGRPD